MKNKYILALIPTLIIWIGGASAAASNIGTLDVTADIGAGNCTIEVTPTTLNLGDIDPALLAGLDKKLVNNNHEEITITPKCTILGDGVKTPNVTLDGDPLGISGEQKKLFRSTTSHSTGFGVGIATIAATGTQPSWTDLKGKDDKVTIQPGATQRFSVAVGCGATADCSPGSLKAGDLAASVTFTFAYE